ncbi:hypothetical protein Tco_0929399, partial [Tanacetum coccineum]
MDNPSITMEEYIELGAEKAHRHGHEFNWEVATYGSIFRVPPYRFNHPISSLTMDEILAKFIDEGVTTRGGKMTSEATRSKEISETGINKNEPPRFEQDEQEKL